MDIAYRLDLAMRAAGLTEAELSRRSEVSQSTVNRILSGKGKYTDAVFLYKLCKVCKVSVEWVISGEDPVDQPTVFVMSITSTEARLLTLYHQCDDDGKATIFAAAEVAKQFSAAALK